MPGQTEMVSGWGLSYLGCFGSPEETLRHQSGGERCRKLWGAPQGFWEARRPWSL